jgi:tetratricopeptide (TPR) repeat protein
MWIAGLVVAVVALVAAAAGWWAYPRGESRLLEQALATAAADPARGEELLRCALDRSDRHYCDAAIVLCRLMVERHAWQEASELYATIDLQPCRPDLLLAFGREALAAERLPQAEAALQSVADRDVPERMAALELLYAHHSKFGQDEKLVATAQALARLDPQNPQRWKQLIGLLTRMSRHGECVEAIRDARQHRLPREMQRELHDVSVQTLINLGDIREAGQELAALRKIEGDSIRVRSHQTYLYRLEGKLDEAIKSISSLMGDGSANQFSLAPPDFQAFAFFTRGIILLDLRRFEEAARDLQRAVAAQPFDSAAEFKLSEAYRALGREGLAKKHRQVAADIVARRKRIRALLDQRQNEPANTDFYAELEQLYEQLGDPAAAARCREWSRLARQWH